MNTHIITKDTQFPIMQNGQNVNITANELLNNIVAVLNASHYRESTQSINSLQENVTKLIDQINTLQENYKILLSQYSVLVDRLTKLEEKLFK